MMEAAMKSKALWFAVMAILLAGLAWAADEDEPGRGVARISLINGDVSVHLGDSGDWIAAALNAPMVVEDTIASGVNSRAEVQFDWANMLRLAANTEVRLAETEGQRYVVQVGRGLVTFRVLRDSDADVEISTPSVSVRPLGRGTYRVEVLEDGITQVTVRSGEADIYTPQGSERLRQGRTLLARGSADRTEFRAMAAIARDEWDSWNQNRDTYLARSASYGYVDNSIYGAEDLDDYGRWVYVAPYGNVWAPYVSADWAPYSYGRWSWIDYYGWTWVSYDPWGWAPFHYGRWFYSAPHGWCWFPGPRHTRNFWRPALVAFFGSGNWGGVGMGIGNGCVGWLPLAPYEPFRPWYGRRMYGFRNGAFTDNGVNIARNTNIFDAYRNARVRGGVVGVESSHFGRRDVEMIRIPEERLRGVDLVTGRMPVAPARESLRISNKEIGPGQVKRAMPDQGFITRRPVNRVEKIPFEQQRQAMEQVSRRAFVGPPERRRSEAASSAPSSGTARVESQQGQAGGLRKTGGSGSTSAETGSLVGQGAAVRNRDAQGSQTAVPSNRRESGGGSGAAESQSGWRRFESAGGSRPLDQRTAREQPSGETHRVAPGVPDQTRSRSVDAPAGERNAQVRVAEPLVRQRVQTPQSAPESRSAEAMPRPSARNEAPRPSSSAGGARRSEAPAERRGR
jgi:hypothetical protein